MNWKKLNWKNVIENSFIVLAAVLFLQTLFFKFTNAPETQYIFQQVLDPWAFDLVGLHLFAPTGIFSQYIIGFGELVASLILIASLFPKFLWLRALGGFAAAHITFVAILLHFGPLGIAVQNADGSSDGGFLFGIAVFIFAIGTFLIVRHHKAFIKESLTYLRNFGILKA